MNKRPVLFPLIIFAILLSCSLSQAQTICPLPANIKPKEVALLDELRKIAVLDQGRIKPLETYADNLLLQLSGKTSINKREATQWLARLLFAPEMTIKDKVFLINSPEIPMALGIEPDKKRRYAFKQIEPAMETLAKLAQAASVIDEKERSIVEQEIIRVYQNALLYIKLTNVFSFAFPHPDFQINDPVLIQHLDLPMQSTFSFIDIALKADLLHEMTKNLESKEKDQWTPRDKELFRLLSNVYHWSMVHRELPLFIVPTVSKSNDAFLSPWDAISLEFQNPQVRNEINYLQSLVIHYWNGEDLQFNIIAKALRKSIEIRLNEEETKRAKNFPLEIFYNQSKPFFWAKLIYGLSLLLFFISLYFSKPLFRKIVFISVIFGFIPHVYGLVSRIIIMQRPPVTNLYETFIFVGFVAVLAGLIIEYFHKRWLGILVAGSSGLIFLSIASKFAAEGDTLRMLVAVLNSNFWLSTHVLSITTGYAGCSVAAIIGHIYIIQGLIKPKDKKLLDTTYRYVVGTLGFGLTMTFLGTILGGIWADQSWGRFWGWDPKENGALLIVLWCAIVFHARVGRVIGPVGFAAGSAMTLIVVMWAWFGVNLLSIGLHSYGFTSGIAVSLAVYVVCELSFLGVSVPVLKRKLKG